MAFLDYIGPRLRDRLRRSNEERRGNQQLARQAARLERDQYVPLASPPPRRPMPEDFGAQQAPPQRRDPSRFLRGAFGGGDPMPERPAPPPRQVPKFFGSAFGGEERDRELEQASRYFDSWMNSSPTARANQEKIVGRSSPEFLRMVNEYRGNLLAKSERIAPEISYLRDTPSTYGAVGPRVNLARPEDQPNAEETMRIIRERGLVNKGPYTTVSGSQFREENAFNPTFQQRGLPAELMSVPGRVAFSTPLDVPGVREGIDETLPDPLAVGLRGALGVVSPFNVATAAAVGPGFGLTRQAALKQLAQGTVTGGMAAAGGQALEETVGAPSYTSDIGLGLGGFYGAGRPSEGLFPGQHAVERAGRAAGRNLVPRRFDPKAAGVVARNTLSDFGRAVPEPETGALLKYEGARPKPGAFDTPRPRVSAEGVEVWHPELPPTSQISTELQRAQEAVNALTDQVRTYTGKRGVVILREKLEKAKENLGRWRAWREVDDLRQSDMPAMEQIAELERRADDAVATIQNLEGAREWNSSLRDTYGQQRGVAIQNAIRDKWGPPDTSTGPLRRAPTGRGGRRYNIEEMGATEAEDMGRASVYGGIVADDGLQIRPVEGEHLVTQGGLTGADKPLFQTEAERQGYRATQGRMDIGSGERPIETAGPMFAQPSPLSHETPGDALRRQIGQRAPEPVSAGPVRQTLADFAGPEAMRGEPLSDHSRFQGSANVSEAAARATNARSAESFDVYRDSVRAYQAEIDAGRIIDPTGEFKPRPADTSHLDEAARLRQQARDLRDLADRGMRPQVHRREAAALEAEATRIEEAGAATPTGVQSPRNADRLAGDSVPGTAEPLPDSGLGGGSGDRVPPGGETPPGGSGGPPRAAAGQVPLEPAPRGWTAIDRAIAEKAETVREPPKSRTARKVAGAVNPSADMPKQPLVGAHASRAVEADLSTSLAAMTKPIVQRVVKAWEDAKPRYIGPAKNKAANTVKDLFDHPNHYEGITPELRSAMDEYRATGYKIVNKLRTEYGVDVMPFESGVEGSVYLPTAQAREAMDEASQRLAASYTSGSVSSKASVTKGRYYEGAFDRQTARPDFTPETDLAKLDAMHNAGLARAAAGETFKRGTKGMTRIDVVDTLRPGLREARDATAKDVASLRGRLETAERRAKQAGISESRLQTSLRKAEGRAAPMEARLDDLGAEFGPEFSYLSGQVRELKQRAAALRNAAGTTAERRALTEAGLLDIRDKLATAQGKLDKLRAQYNNMNLEPYVRSQQTNLYHTAEDALAIAQITPTRPGAGNTVLNVMDEVRQTVFTADASPLTIQGLLAWATNPPRATLNAAKAARSLFDPDNMLRIAREEADTVAAFNRANERAFGSPLAEFMQEGQGATRIPLIGKGIGELNTRVLAAVETIRYALWKADVKLLKRMNPEMSEAMAANEASNFSSKAVPAINPMERGVSPLRAKIERLPVISTSFILGPAGMLTDATKALAKLTISSKLSPAARWQALAGREQLALIRGSTMAASLVTLSVGSYVAAGYSPEQAARTALDHRSGRFLSIAVGKDKYIPIGGPVRSFVKALLPGDIGAGVPVPGAGLGRFAESKMAPLVRLPLELKTNKDWQGRPIKTKSGLAGTLQTLWYAAESVLPLSVGAASENVRHGTTDFGTMATDTASQLAGGNLYETAPSTQKNERAAEIVAASGVPEYAEQAGRNYWEMDIGPQALIDADPEAKALQEKIDQRQRERGQPEQLAKDKVDAKQAEITAEQEADNKRLAAGTMEYDEWKTNTMVRRASLRAAKEMAYGTDFERNTEGQPTRAAVDRYFQIGADAIAANTDELTGDINWDVVKAKQEKAFEGLTDRQRQDAQDYIERNLTETERDEKAAQRLYYDSPIPKYRGMDADESRAVDDFIRKVDETQQMLQDELGYPVLKKNVAEVMAEDMGDMGMFDDWTRLSKKETTEVISPRYDHWLKRHRDELEPFFGWLYNRSFEERIGEYTTVSPFAGPAKPKLPPKPPRPPTPLEQYRDRQEQDVIERELAGAR